MEEILSDTPKRRRNYAGRDSTMGKRNNTKKKLWKSNQQEDEIIKKLKNSIKNICTGKALKLVGITAEMIKAQS